MSKQRYTVRSYGNQWVVLDTATDNTVWTAERCCDADGLALALNEGAAVAAPLPVDGPSVEDPAYKDSQQRRRRLAWAHFTAVEQMIEQAFRRTRAVDSPGGPVSELAKFGGENADEGKQLCGALIRAQRQLRHDREGIIRATDLRDMARRAEKE